MVGFNADFNGGSKMGFKEYSDGTLREGFKILVGGSIPYKGFHLISMCLQGFKNFGAVCFSKHNFDPLCDNCSWCDYLWREGLLGNILVQVSKQSAV